MTNQRLPFGDLTFRPPDGLADADLVLKGGLGSGLIYSTAAPALATRYRFRSIGGTSAGAVGAALTAAAEFSRARTDSTAGYKAFWRTGEALVRKPRLFQTIFLPFPRRRSRENTDALEELRERYTTEIERLRNQDKPVTDPPLERHKTASCFELLVLRALVRSALRARRWPSRLSSRIPRPVRIVLAVLAVVGVTMLAVSLRARWRGVLSIVGTTGLVGTVVIACVGWLLLRTLRRPGTGLVGGGALTTWLHKSVQKAAGLGCDQKPLTIADLRHAAPGREIDLRFTATDVTLGQPVALPLAPEVHEYYFNPLEWIDQELFAKPIMNYLLAVSPPDRYGFSRLPGDDLPVVVAARMSLSFPFVFRTVPLWKPASPRTPFVPGNLRRHVISDGGMSSNFPIHFFDAWLPRHPTFGLRLQSESDGDAGSTGIGALVSGIYDALLNGGDKAQAALPGYGDRVVEIGYPGRLGGSNLCPTRRELAEMRSIGHAAAKRFLARQFDFGRHRQTRYRLLARELRGNLLPASRTVEARSSLADSFANFAPDLTAQPGGSEQVRAVGDLLRAVVPWSRFGPLDQSTQDPTLRITPR